MQSVYGVLYQEIYQAKELCMGVPIPFIDLDPFKDALDRTLVDRQSAAYQSKEA